MNPAEMNAEQLLDYLHSLIAELREQSKKHVELIKAQELYIEWIQHDQKGVNYTELWNKIEQLKKEIQ